MRPRLNSGLRRFSDLCFVAILVWMALPDIWTRALLIGPIPIHFVITQLLWLSLALEAISNRRPASAFQWCLALTIGYAAARSAFAADQNNWDLKYFVSDLWTLQVFVLGFMWSRRRTLPEIAGVCRITGAFMIPLALLTIAGLYLGFVRPYDQEFTDRLYTSSLWSIGCTAQFLWPIHFASSKETGNFDRMLPRFRNAYLRLSGHLLAPLALLVAVFTATRSLLIVSILSYVVVWCIQPKRNTQHLAVATFLLTVFLVIGFASASLVRAKGYSALDRLQQTDLTQEGRRVELEWLFNQLGDDVVAGWGLGSLFFSTIKYHNRPLEVAPHVGIFTFLLKGGILMAMIFVVLPLLMCLRSLRHRTERARAGIGCVLVYCATASLSGGWYPYQMLLFGVGVGMVSIRKMTGNYSLPTGRCRGGLAQLAKGGNYACGSST